MSRPPASARREGYLGRPQITPGRWLSPCEVFKSTLMKASVSMKTSRRSVIRSAAAISGLAVLDSIKVIQLQAQPAALPPPTATQSDSAVIERCSPREGDHFEVAKPLFFWQTSPQIKRYSLFVDGTRVTTIPFLRVCSEFWPDHPARAWYSPLDGKGNHCFG